MITADDADDSIPPPSRNGLRHQLFLGAAPSTDIFPSTQLVASASIDSSPPKLPLQTEAPPLKRNIDIFSERLGLAAVNFNTSTCTCSNSARARNSANGAQSGLKL